MHAKGHIFEHCVMNPGERKEGIKNSLKIIVFNTKYDYYAYFTFCKPLNLGLCTF